MCMVRILQSQLGVGHIAIQPMGRPVVRIRKSRG